MFHLMIFYHQFIKVILILNLKKFLQENIHIIPLTNNMIGNTNIEHKGISLIEKFIDKNNKDIDLSLDITDTKKYMTLCK